MPASASTGSGTPVAVTVMIRATSVVAPYDVPPANAGGVAAATETLTICVATPMLLLAVNEKVRGPASPSGGE